MKNLFFLLPFLILFIFISGCKSSRVVVRERPVAPHYVQPLAPGPNYVWHSGEWFRRGNRYVFHKGFWIKAHSHKNIYTPGHWQRTNKGWLWISGHWR